MWERVVGNKGREAAKGQVMCSLGGHNKEFDFYDNTRNIQSFKEENDRLWCVFNRDLWLLCQMAFCGGRKGKKTIDLEAIDIIQQKIIVNKVMEGVKEERSGLILDTF